MAEFVEGRPFVYAETVHSTMRSKKRLLPSSKRRSVPLCAVFHGVVSVGETTTSRERAEWAHEPKSSRATGLGHHASATFQSPACRQIGGADIVRGGHVRKPFSRISARVRTRRSSC